ncbi:MAG: 50S ribosomal protein L18 [Bacteroidales bacterium]|jgi:large subunit ribosomal protein L18|nr:50S ribosomal protein L18 [Bacteroidales bacterium]
MALTKLERRARIKLRIRKRVYGTKDQPRLSVFRSNKQIYAQLIDDAEGKTLLSVSSRIKEIAEKKGITKVEQAKLVGKLAAEKSKESGITEVIFDRNGYLYHGRIKALAEAAREGGLKF